VKSRWIGKLMLAAGGAVVALLLAEVLVRLFGLAPQLAAIQVDQPHASYVSSPNPILKYVPKPGSGEVNHDGFRGPTYARSKPEGTFRVVVVGDSIGFGYCDEGRTIEVDHTFARLLEDELNRRGVDGFDRVEVLNLSVPGYDTLQEIEFLETKGLAYRPDAVVIAYCLNDLMLASRELFLFRKHEGWEAYRSAADRVYRNAVYRSHLVRFVWQRAPGLVARLASKGEATAITPEPGLPRTREGFRRARTLADRHGFRALVAIFPFFRDFDRYPYLPLHASVAGEARQHALEPIDLLPAFAAASSETTDLCAPCCDIHPNERGHAVAARVIAERLP